MKCMIEDARKQERKGLVLTCKETLISYYAKFGFIDEGITDKSVHGNAVWHQMRLTFYILIAFPFFGTKSFDISACSIVSSFVILLAVFL